MGTGNIALWYCLLALLKVPGSLLQREAEPVNIVKNNNFPETDSDKTKQ